MFNLFWLTEVPCWFKGRFFDQEVTPGSLALCIYTQTQWNGLHADSAWEGVSADFNASMVQAVGAKAISFTRSECGDYRSPNPKIQPSSTAVYSLGESG